jgi:hypothetical protein
MKNKNERFIITDLDPEDAHYTQKEQIIGMEVEFLRPLTWYKVISTSGINHKKPFQLSKICILGGSKKFLVSTKK